MLKYKEHDLGYKKMYEALLSKEGISFNASKEIVFDPQPLQRIHTLWDETQFSEINLPHKLFSLTQEDTEHYSLGETIRVLDMPIKFPGSNYRLPNELKQLENIVSQIANHEEIINPNIKEYYCYLTLDRKLVKAGNTTRKAGIHVDGFQGARLGEKLPIDHSYICYSALPTLYYNQSFKVEDYWDKTCHNYFEGFERQKNSENVVTYPENTVLLMDAYCLHEAPMVEKDTFRSFLRLSYSVREFDRLGNAHNSMFDYDWEMFPRDIQSSLVCPSKKGYKI